MRRIKELSFCCTVAMQTLKQNTAASFRPQTVYKGGQISEASGVVLSGFVE